MDSVWQDLRYGLRGLRNRPGFAALAVLTLALGIGATTTIFSVIHGVLLDPFPYQDAGRVVLIQVHDDTRSGDGGRGQFRTDEFLDYQAGSHVFDDVIAGSFENFTYTTREGAERIRGALVSTNTFTFLGVPAALGRVLTAGDALPSAPPVCVISYKWWRTRFNLDPTVLGQAFMIDGTPTTVVGIMPPRFTKLDADIYRAARLDRADERTNQRYWRFQGKLKPGVSFEQAAAELDLIAHRVAQVHPDDYPKNFHLRVIGWVDSLVGGFRQTLYTLAAAVGLLLLIACANVANMLLARATAREKEMAVRAALGATRGRLVRQLLIESGLLGVLGTGAGCLFAYAGVKVLIAAMPEATIPHEAVIELNPRVLLFSLAVAAVTTVLFGLVPALQTARRDLVESLKDSAKGGGGFRRARLRGALVVFEIALSLVLLTGAGLMMRSFVHLQGLAIGFDPKNILVTELVLPVGQYDKPAQRRQFFQQLLPRLKALPGVASVSTMTAYPPYFASSCDVDIPGRTHAEKWRAAFDLCDENYPATLGVKLVTGRWLSPVEVQDGRRTVVVNQTFARRYLGAENPLGRRVKLDAFDLDAAGKPDTTGFEIVGVVADFKNQGVQDPPLPQAFLPKVLSDDRYPSLYVRTRTNPAALVETMRREIWAVDRGVSTGFVMSLTDYMKRFTYAEPRFSLLVLGVLAGVGLLLVAIGVYSVIAYTVSRQTHEIGIRMALGATPRDVLRLVMRLGLRQIGLGIAIGVLLSLAVTRVLEHQLESVSAQDPWTFAGVAIVIALVGLAACYFPARRATRVHPMVALRHE